MENDGPTQHHKRMVGVVIAHPDLTDEQSSHVEEISRDFCNLMADKYIKGQREHGGNLWDLTEEQLLENAIDEAIDQVVYLLTIRRKQRARKAAGNT